MQRRTVLKWISGVIATACTAVTGVPIIRFLLAPLSRRTTQGPITARVATLDELLPGKPKQIAIVGRQQDAWTSYPSQVIGQVWLVRDQQQADSPGDVHVAAYSAECPHHGCVVQWNTSDKNFVCPCHQAAFSMDGQAWTEQQLGFDNPSKRNMDDLACRVVHDAEADVWWVEVDFQRFKLGTAQKVPV